MKAHLQSLLRGALNSLLEQAGDGVSAPDHIQIDATKDVKHGDFATNLALALAKPLGKPPRAVAELLVKHLPASEQVVKVEIAGPGFINFFLAKNTFQSVVRSVLEQGEQFGRIAPQADKRTMVEFVSANPTGPLHVGHGRNAAYGDTLANLLAATGWTVWREYYINDAGRQVDVLAVSAWLRYLELLGEVVKIPARGYPGNYLRATADGLEARHGRAFHRAAAEVFEGLSQEPGGNEFADEDEKARIKAGQEEYLDLLIEKVRLLLGPDYETVQRFAVEDQLAAIRLTLEGFEVRFDNWYSERELIQSGAAERARAKLKASGHTYEKDGALWFRTTERGDDKDRVLVKANGAATYFGNDLAYHVDKMERISKGGGRPQLINVWGADHHGLLVRMRAAIESLTGRKDALNVQLIQFVTLSSGRMGKRSGNFVTLQDLISEAGKDATRFFYLIRSHDQHLDFDIDLARSQSTDNPVYYVQYAHARIVSVFAQLAERGGTWERERGLAALARLDNDHEKTLLTALNRYPEVLRSAAANFAPHTLAFYLKNELADALHSYYNAHKFLVDDAGLQAARLALIEATRIVLASGLAILGVSAPNRMDPV
jgi:arginyl-tRNA synthetase